MHFIYIIYSERLDIYYKGETVDVENRLIDHNRNRSRFTKNKGPWKLVFSRAYNTRKEALIEEKRIKRLNKRSIIKLIGKS